MSNSVQSHGRQPTGVTPIPGILQARTLEWVAISFSMTLLMLPVYYLYSICSTKLLVLAFPNMWLSLRQKWWLDDLELSTECILLYLEEEMQPTLAFLPGETHDRGAWWAIVHGFTKSQTQLNDWARTYF